MERNDSSTAMSLLQAGYGEDSDEETSFTEINSVDNSSDAKPPQNRVRRNSAYKDNNDLMRLISQDSYTDQPADFISDEEEHHHDSYQEETEDKKEVLSTIESQASQDAVARLAADPMAVSSQDENSGSSFAEGASGRRKKSSKPSTKILVSYVADDQDEDEEASESNEQSSDEEKQMDQSPASNSPQEIAVSSPGPRGLAGIDSNNIQLPPEPAGKCSRELQEKINEYYRRTKQGDVDPNKQIQRLTSFRNPSIYEKLIQQFKIDEKGSNFPLDLYNPHMWGKESFYDELDKAQKKDMERREKERKEKTKIEFISGTKKTAAPAPELSGAPDEKKRKSKWDAQPTSAQQQQQQRPGSMGPVGSAGVVNLTATATGTKATVISAVGTLLKKPSIGGIGNNLVTK
ncbi:SAP30-binding protein-like [Pomacea canaliculata]|uniref:SAP30-binding protein-like n=1 Tax=Pomacea canaliculata TaxID=400727 RepID=UPI000D725AD6|nr:SAP30-binding protein-like [Pomacea canaliculata]